jgi:hypothetical protein
MTTESATSNLGAHLLGRVPSLPDARNYPMSAFPEGTASELDVALIAALPWHSVKMQKWMKLVTAAAEGSTPVPTPTPTPVPTTGVLWPDTEQLDQGQTGHCVGFGWAQFGNDKGADGIDDHYTDTDGHKIYYECKVIDGEPKQENGSSVHSGAQAMKARKRIGVYVWAANVDEIKQWVLKNGPVTVGVDWYNDMFNPDANGFVFPTGGVAGGHCFLVVGYDPATDVLTFQNSWGAGWGLNGYFKMHAKDFAAIYANQGEGCTTVEIV